MVETHPYRVVLADDHVLIRHGIKNIISQNDDLEVVGEVGDGEELLELLDRQPVVAFFGNAASPS